MRNGIAISLTLLVVAACAPIQEPPPPIRSAVYVGNAVAPGVTLYSADPDSGEIKAVRSIGQRQHSLTEGRVHDLAYQDRGRWLFASTLGKPALTRFRAEGQIAFLGEAEEIPIATQVSELELHPDGRTLYAVARDWRGVLAYSIDDESGALRELPGTPFAARDEEGNRVLAESVAVARDGKWFLSASGAAVIAHRIVTWDGTLEQVSAASAPGRASFLAIDPLAEFVVTAGWAEDASTLALFRFDDETGLLALEHEVEIEKPFASGVRIDPRGRFVHVTGNDRIGQGGWLRSFELDRGAARLEPLERDPAREMRIAGELVFDPYGLGGFALAFSGAGIHSLAYDAREGSLTERSSVGFHSLATLLGDSRTNRPVAIAYLR